MYSGHVLKHIEKKLEKRCLGTWRHQLDWERSSILEYDYVPERKCLPKNPGETERPDLPKDLSENAKRWQLRESPLRYFLDGSRRTYKIADIPVGTQYMPIIAGQVGVGVCCRKNRQLSIDKDFRIHYVLALPASLDPDGKTERQHEIFFDELRNDINKQISSKNGFHFQLEKLLFYSANLHDNCEDKAVAAIQDYMITREKEVVKNLVEKNCLFTNSSGSSWLVKDGSLEYAKLNPKDPFSFSNICNNYNHVIGVSKSFNPDLALLTKGRPASRMIAELKPFHRTPVFRYETERVEGVFAVWYLRIRESCGINRSPFDGVVKVEKLLISKTEKESGLNTKRVDDISAWIINERNPVAYNKDARWANLLYPIYLTENYIKSRYLGTLSFVNLF